MTQGCPQLENLPANVRKFWEERQHTLQDTLLRFSYGVLVESTDMMLREKSGLLYLMQRDLWFEDFQKSSLFSSLFQQGTEYTKTQIQIPRTAIMDVRLVPAIELGHELLGKRPSSEGFGAFFRLFKPRPNTLLLVRADAAGQPVRCAFRDIDEPDAWYRALSAPETL